MINRMINRIRSILQQLIPQSIDRHVTPPPVQKCPCIVGCRVDAIGGPNDGGCFVVPPEMELLEEIGYIGDDLGRGVVAVYELIIGQDEIDGKYCVYIDANLRPDQMAERIDHYLRSSRRAEA